MICLTNLYADNVKMFTDHRPSAEEMGNLLFSEPSAEKSLDTPVKKIRMRSISFGKVKQAAPETVSEPAANVIGLPIKFAYNSTNILSESMPFLDEVGKMLNLQQYAGEKLVVEGHTDARGPANYNLDLSIKRAEAVKDYLASHFQIAAARLLVRGKGESNPLPGISPFNGANRRVQFYKAP